jgi:hypothetical protein
MAMQIQLRGYGYTFNIPLPSAKKLVSGQQGIRAEEAATSLCIHDSIINQTFVLIQNSGWIQYQGSALFLIKYRIGFTCFYII